MALTYLLDEHLCGMLWNLVGRHNAQCVDRIDVVRVGDVNGPSLATKDPALLLWTERENRILVTEDRDTMAAHLAAHLAAGHRSPGVMTIRPGYAWRQVLEFLVLASYASEPSEWADLKTVLNEVRDWPVEQRLRLVEEVWSGLCNTSDWAQRHDELKALLDCRAESLDQNPEAVISWEAVDARALARFRP